MSCFAQYKLLTTYCMSLQAESSSLELYSVLIKDIEKIVFWIILRNFAF